MSSCMDRRGKQGQGVPKLGTELEKRLQMLPV